MTVAGTTRYLGEAYEVGPTSTTKHIFAGSQRIATKDSTGALRFYHTDHLGSSNVVTDATGALVELNEHAPYGALVRHEGPADVHHKFTGQHQDSGTGLILFPARAYDPQLGRFLQPDPFVQEPSDPQTLNRYAYVRNNPVNFVDPSGYFAWFAFLVAAIAAVFVVAAVVSVVASTVSLIASATGHERTAQRAAKVAVTAAWVAMGASVVLTAATLGEAGGTVQAAGWILAYAYTAQAVANWKSTQEAAVKLGTSAGAAEAAASAQFRQVAQEQHPNLEARAPTGRFGDYTIVQGPLGPRFIDRQGRLDPWPGYADPLSDSSQKALKQMSDSLTSDPARMLRWAGRGLTETGHPGIGRPLGIAGLVLETGGPGKLTGIAIGGGIGAWFGRVVFGPLGGIAGSFVGGAIGGRIGSHIDNRYLSYGE